MEVIRVSAGVWKCGDYAHFGTFGMRGDDFCRKQIA